MKKILKKILAAIDEAVFPSNIYCMCCGSLIDASRPYAICDICTKKLHWITGRTCEKCGKALSDTYRGRLCYDCMIYEHSFERGFSCLTYGLYERKLLLEHKYRGKGYMAAKFGDILYDRISCEDIHTDVIIPVPVSRERMKKRGYNQSALMSRRLAERRGIPVEEHLLVRKKETKPLRSLNPAERSLALDGAFGVSTTKKGKSIIGKTVLLVDDIYTTGATADECSRVLLEAGACRVYLLSLASGGNRRPESE